jgi:hypothetical protein
MDIIRIVKSFEKEFLKNNTELYENDRIEFLKKKEEFVSQKMLEMKKDE